MAQTAAAAIDEQGQLPRSFVLAADEQLTLAILERRGESGLHRHAADRAGKRSLLQLHSHELNEVLWIGGGTKQADLEKNGPARRAIEPAEKLHGSFPAIGQGPRDAAEQFANDL